MAIEFHCEKCQQLVRTPDAAAGKKGKCPHCGAVMRIPSPVAPAASPNPVGDEIGLADEPPPKPATPQPATPQPAMPQPATPQPATPQPATPQPATKSAPKQTANASFSGTAKSGGGGVVALACPACRKTVSVPVAAAGKKGRCPHCQTVFEIPRKRPAAAPANVAAGAKTTSPASKPKSQPHSPVTDIPDLTPLGADDGGAGLVPLDEDIPELPVAPVGLVPLKPIQPLGPQAPTLPAGLNALGQPTGMPSLQPLGGLSPLGGPQPVGGLQPLNGLQPLGPAPLSPLSDFADPLASLPAVATSNALPSGGLKPYSSPAPRSSVSAASQVRRTGLPWETGSEGGFYETAKLVLFRPVTAFQMVHRKRGVGEPMSYVASCATLALVMNIIYLTLFIVLILTAAGKLDQVSGVKVGIFVAQLIMSSVGGIVGAIMSPLLAACVFHIGLLIVGSGQAGYEGTYRVCAYSYGSSMLLAIVPLLGLLAMPWYCIALLMIGFKNVHEGAYWQAAFATIFPYGAMMLCCCGLQFLGAMLS